MFLLKKHTETLVSIYEYNYSKQMKNIPDINLV